MSADENEILVDAELWWQGKVRATVALVLEALASPPCGEHSPTPPRLKRSAGAGGHVPALFHRAPLVSPTTSTADSTPLIDAVQRALDTESHQFRPALRAHQQQESGS